MSQWPEPPPDPPRCPNCGYALSGIDSARCPECATDRASHLARRARRARRIRAAILVILAVLVAAGARLVWTLVRVQRELIRAEFRLQAVKVVCDVIADHAERHRAEWPKSWAELESWSHEHKRDPLANWDLSPSLKSELQIDFTVGIDQVCAGSASSFQALRPVPGRIQYSCDQEIDDLLSALRARRDSSGPPSTQPHITGSQK